MYPGLHTGAKSYASVGLETGVSATDPHGLILMLFDGALLSVMQARQAIARSDAPARSGSIHKAILIIEEGLVVALDDRSGSPLAGHLRSLYQYISTRLLAASLKSDVDALDEAERLLTELRDAWKAIAPARAANAANLMPGRRAAA